MLLPRIPRFSAGLSPSRTLFLASFPRPSPATFCRQFQALHFAARYGHSDIVDFLLKKGADPAATNNQGKTPYDLASFWGFSSVAEEVAKKAGKKVAAKPTVSLGAKKGSGVKLGGAGKTTLGPAKPADQKRSLSTSTKAVGAETAKATVKVNKEHINFFSGNPLKRCVLQSELLDSISHI